MSVSPSSAVQALGSSEHESQKVTPEREMRNMASNPFPELSDELLVRIFSCVTASDLGKQACVSRRWRAVSAEKSLWKALCAQSKVNVSVEPRIGWKQQYIKAVVEKPNKVIVKTHTSVDRSLEPKICGCYTPGPFI